MTVPGQATRQPMPRPARCLRRLGALALLGAALLAGCASDGPQPAPLEALTPTIAGRQVWRAKVAGIGFPLVASARNGAFFVGDDKGTVLALDAETGAERWRASAGAALSAGVGSDGRFAVVVTEDNEVVSFDAGREVWRRRVPSRVVTPPYVAGERAFVMSVDRAVHAFDVGDGRRLWTLQRPGDALTLSQASVISAYQNTLLVAQGARLAALDPLRGSLLWETPLTVPRGTNEVERLADLLGPALRLGDKLCARAFQSAVGCIDVARGSAVWSRNVGGVQAIGGNEELLVGADASSRMTAWKTGTGEIVWSHERFLHRGLSGALVVGPTAVFGDAEGFVHFVALATGQTQLRLSTDGSPVVGTPVVSGTTVLVTTRDGGLFAFRPN